MSKTAKHFLPNGKVYTGAKHTASSQKLIHTAPMKAKNEDDKYVY